MGEPGAELVVLDQNDTFAAAYYRGIFVIAWHGAPTLEGLLALWPIRGQVQELAANGGYVSLTLLPAGALVVGPEVRAEAERLSSSVTPKLRAMAQVVMATGFRGATSRLVLSGLFALKRTPYPVAIFEQPQKAVRWLLRHMGEGAPTHAEAVAVVLGLIRT